MPAQQNRIHLGVYFFQYSLCMALLLAAFPSMADIYKWTDQHGQVQYSDRPAPAEHPATKISISHNSTTQPRISKEELEINAINRREAETEKKKRQPITKQVRKKIPAGERRRLCQQAVSDLAAIRSRGRMREINSKGEYIYLSEQQRQQRIATAEKKRRKYCR